MQRRKFLTNSTSCIIGISVFGTITRNGNFFIGDDPTTTDILGPFYRPGAPIRSNINPAGFSGDLLHVSGTVFKEDGTTPFQNCFIEIWQCDQHQIYDNTSDDYTYRGAQKTLADGKYHFMTTQPVAYPAAPNSNVYRPAHIHMRVSGEKQQDLITQIYFKGDPNIENDPCASSPRSTKRILNVTSIKHNEKQIHFDIAMAKEFKPDDTVFEKLSGLYTMKDNSIIEFYRGGDLLFMKWNGQIREGLWYKGNNAFVGGIDNNASFELLENGAIKVKVHFVTVLKKEFNLEGIKTFKYK